jgi:Flp pilus assembly protein TadD
MGQYDKARVQIEKALKKNPANAESNYHLGVVLFKTGQKNEAKTRIEAALKPGKDFPGKPEAEKLLKEITGRA